MGRIFLTALFASVVLGGCVNVEPKRSSGYDGERTGPYTNYSTYPAPTKPPYRDTYVVHTKGKGAKVIVDERYEPRPAKW
jgi:hypothetical protein